MTVGRVLGTMTAALTVAGCAALVVGMARADAEKQSAADAAAKRLDVVQVVPTRSIPAQLPLTSAHSAAGAGTPVGAAALAGSPVGSTSAGRASSPAGSSTTTSAAGKPTASSSVRSATPSKATPRTTVRTTVQAVPKATPKVTPTATPRTTARSSAKPAPKPVVAPRAAPKKGVALPLKMSTGKATRVITVRASSHSSTTAVLQAWTKAPGGGWLRYGSSVTAHVGSQGLTSSPSESKSATPIGSFSLTRAFGHYSDPGTPLPYVHTTPSYWWISQAGPLYNTLQHCSSRCSFNQGSPNEHLYYETPYYNYAVVIDYNTRNAGPVRQGAGSAFFLHVTDGRPTAGCVAIPQSKLISLMRWLKPTAHPRILIGVA